MHVFRFVFGPMCASRHVASGAGVHATLSDFISLRHDDRRVRLLHLC